VHRADALKWLRSAEDLYDLVFLDPPYDLAGRLGGELAAALPVVLGPGATVVAESDRRRPLDLSLALKDERRYGDTLIRIYES
jgi:16S rRNA (guanine966-N2)-methyltransferase